MKSTVLLSGMSCVLLLGTGIAQANGFFQENKDFLPDTMQFEQSQSSYDAQFMSQDDFILDQQNPHNFFNPYNPQSLPFNKPSEVEANMDDSPLISEIQEPDGALEQKSENAFRKNRLNAELSLSENKEQLLENEPQLSGIELSELTSSNLVLSAQKKKFIEKLLPALLSDRRILLQERERLELLLSQFEQGNRIDDVDELWLRQLVRDYHIQEKEDFQKKF